MNYEIIKTFIKGNLNTLCVMYLIHRYVPAYYILVSVKIKFEKCAQSKNTEPEQRYYPLRLDSIEN